MPHHYPAEVFWSDEDEGFIALARDLPGCSAFGETRLEALDELEHAISAWTTAAQAAGNPVPEPSRPQAEASHSGKLLVRLPKSLHSKLARQAETEEVSLNQYVVCLLAESNSAHVVSKAVIEVVEHSILSGLFNSSSVVRHMATSFEIKTFDFSSSRVSQHTAASAPFEFAPRLQVAGD